MLIVSRVCWSKDLVSVSWTTEKAFFYSFIPWTGPVLCLQPGEKWKIKSRRCIIYHISLSPTRVCLSNLSLLHLFPIFRSHLEIKLQALDHAEGYAFSGLARLRDESGLLPSWLHCIIVFGLERVSTQHVWVIVRTAQSNMLLQITILKIVSFRNFWTHVALGPRTCVCVAIVIHHCSELDHGNNELPRVPNEAAVPSFWLFDYLIKTEHGTTELFFLVRNDNDFCCQSTGLIAFWGDGKPSMK